MKCRSLITQPVLTELVKLTLSPSSVTAMNNVAAGKLLLAWRARCEETALLDTDNLLSLILQCPIPLGQISL